MCCVFTGVLRFAKVSVVMEHFMVVNLLSELSLCVSTLMTVPVRSPYAVLIEFSSSSPRFVLSLRLAILARAFHLQSIPIELLMNGK